jgi:hypothetical protein
MVMSLLREGKCLAMAIKVQGNIFFLLSFMSLP